MKIKLTALNGSYVFTLSELDEKILKFFKSVKMTKEDSRGFKWSLRYGSTTMTKEFGEVDTSRLVYTKLIKYINCDYTVNITKLNIRTPGLYSPDGYVIEYVSDGKTAKLIQAYNGWYDSAQFRKELSAMGFKHNKECWVVDASYPVLSRLNRLGFDNFCVLDDSYKKLRTRMGKLETERNELAFNFTKLYKEAVIFCGDKTPYQHQVDFLKSRTDWGNYLALDMGLGKTWTALYACSVYKRYMDLQIIVICPRSVKQNWVHTALDEFNQNIMCYSTASIPDPSMITGRYILVADEAHFAADIRSQRTKKYLKLAYNAHIVLNLSGTACTNGRPADLYAQLKAIGFEGTTSLKEYQHEYGWDAKINSLAMQRLAEALGSKYFYRHATQCLDLPALRRTKHYIKLSEEQEKVFTERYTTFMNTFLERVAQGIVSDGFQQFVELQGLRLSIAKAKAIHCAELASDIVDNHHQVAVYSDFTEPIQDAYDVLTKLNIKCVWLQAEDDDKTRYAKQKAFQSGEYSVFFSTYKCGGVGIELTPCDRMILIDRPWSPAMVTQCEKRIARIGQKHPVLIYWAYWEDPEHIDAAVESTVMQKQGNIDSFNAFDTELNSFE